MSIRVTTSGKKPFNIVVTPDDKIEFFNLYILIRRYADNGKNPPYGLVLRFFEMMYNAEEYKVSEMVNEARRHADSAVERLAARKDYQFRWKERTIANTEQAFSPDTTLIFTEMICGFLDSKRDFPEAGRDEAIAFFYQALDQFYVQELSDECRNDFSDYRQATLCGVLAMAVGFQLSSKKDPTFKDIYHATRNAIRNYKNGLTALEP